jgi:hypothetical protein
VFIFNLKNIRIMNFCTTTFFASALFILLNSFTAPQDVTVRYGTPVICELTGDVTLDDKPGKAVVMIVKEDVVVDGAVVIAKGRSLLQLLFV